MNWFWKRTGTRHCTIVLTRYI